MLRKELENLRLDFLTLLFCALLVLFIIPAQPSPFQLMLPESCGSLR